MCDSPIKIFVPLKWNRFPDGFFDSLVLYSSEAFSKVVKLAADFCLLLTRLQLPNLHGQWASVLLQGPMSNVQNVPPVESGTNVEKMYGVS